jgi:hypothetical protein
MKVIDASVENAVLEVITAGRTTPKTWRKSGFSPANVYKDALDVLAFVHGEDEWNINFDKESKMFEVYVVDKKYSVASISLARALIGAMWNYHQLKSKAENINA